MDETVVVTVDEVGLPGGVTPNPDSGTLNVHINPSDNKLFVRAPTGHQNNFLYGDADTRPRAFEIIADTPLRITAIIKLVTNETDGDNRPDVTISSSNGAAYDPSTGNVTLTPNDSGVYRVNVAVVKDDGPDQSEDIAFTLATADSGGNIPAG